MNTVRLLSIDAWRESEGDWTWNNWHERAQVPATLADLKPRALFAWLRTNGYLSAQSAGRVALDDDGYNVVILSKRTRQPLYAIAYGELLEKENAL